MHLLSISSLSDGDLAELLANAKEFALDPAAGRDRLAGRTIFNCFYENSTRTAMSFAQAAARLGAQAITLSVEHSSVKKGETLWEIAEMHYGKGKGAKYTEIVKANTPPVKNPDLIQPGWVLRIPPLS